jgi:hypothetical protein
MHFTLLVPGALVPSGWASELAQALKAPCLSARLARASLESELRAPDEMRGAAHLAWLSPRIFGQAVAAKSDAPTAPYAFAALSGRPPASVTLIFHADPVHFGFARDHLVVETLDDAVEDEISALLDAAKEVCAAQDVRLQRVGGHSFLSVEDPWDLVTTSRAAAWGRPVDAVLPTGVDATRWSRLHNEIQMIWHAHPVNLERERSGQRAINGLWLSGGGTWQPLPKLAFTSLNVDAPELQGAAAAAGMRLAGAEAAPVDGGLVVNVEPFHARVRQDWATWLAAMARLDAWLAGQAAASIDLVLAGHDRVRTLRSRPRDAMRFWRNAPLARVLAE